MQARETAVHGIRGLQARKSAEDVDKSHVEIFGNCGERSAGSVRVAGRHHYQADASTTAAARRRSGRDYDRGDVGWMGLGNSDPVVGALDGTDGICGRMHTLARCRSAGCEPAVERGFARSADRGNPALARARQALPIVKMGGICSPALSENTRPDPERR